MSIRFKASKMTVKIGMIEISKRFLVLLTENGEESVAYILILE